MTATRPDFELRSTAELFDHALIRRRVAKELPDVDPFLQSVAAGLVEQLRERLPAELLDDAGSC